MWKHAVKVVMAAGEAFGKALSKAVREEMQATKHAAERQATAAGGSASREETRANANTSARLGISMEESLKILDVKEPLNAEDVQKRYNFLFDLNDKTKGGSFYLQSKIFRAKERIDEELRVKEEREGRTEPSGEEPPKKE